MAHRCFNRFCFAEHLENYARETSGMHLGVLEKCSLVLLDFKQIWNESSYFSIDETYPVPWKCLQHFSSCYMKKAGQKCIKEQKMYVYSCLSRTHPKSHS